MVHLNHTKPIPVVPGIPLLGNSIEMMKDPAAFFLRAYLKYGSAYRVNVFGRKTIVIAGREAALFMSTSKGRDSLRSREFWEDFRKFFGAKRLLTGSDGAEHRELRAIMYQGFSRDAAQGHYDELTDIVDKSIARDWITGTKVPILEACQYMVVQQIGELMTGHAPLEYVKDIRTNILFLLNTLVTRQRPKFFLMHPKFKKATRRFNQFGRELIVEFKAHAEAGTLPKNLLGDVMRAHKEFPDIVPESDLLLSLTGPFVAGLDTVANTLAATIYGILKTPHLLEKIQQEADSLYAKQEVTESDVLGLEVTLGSVQEAMRLWPIAVAQMRTATKDFEFGGYTIPAGELLYIATSVPHFMEEHFPNPKDFDHTRFSQDKNEHKKPGVYSPFGRGTHTCLGKNLAMVLMGIAISRLFHRMDLALESPDYVLKTKTSPTPGPAMSFKVIVKGERKPAIAIPSSTETLAI